MKQHFNCTEPVQYKDIQIMVHWIRKEYRIKSDLHIFEHDDGTELIEKDYIFFDYKGISIQDSYNSYEHDLGERVFEICNIIDSGKNDELTAIGVEWTISK